MTTTVDDDDHRCCVRRFPLFSLPRYLNSPVTFDMTSEIVKAANTLLNFTSDNAIEGADSIPKDLIADARGLAFITFVKVCRTTSFFCVGRGGSLLLSRGVGRVRFVRRARWFIAIVEVCWMRWFISCQGVVDDMAYHYCCGVLDRVVEGRANMIRLNMMTQHNELELGELSRGVGIISPASASCFFCW